MAFLQPVIFILVLCLFGISSSNDPLTSYQCKAEIAPHYIVPDPHQCDRFLRCINGRGVVEYCDDGFALDTSRGNCDHLAKVDCSGRTKLQERPKEKNISKDCPKANGFFAVKSSCDRYIDCRDGVAYFQKCGFGTVFNEARGTCIHPEQVPKGDKCTSETIFEFKCPEREQGYIPKFGDHDRVPHPTDCSQFYACVYPDNYPRLSSCKKPTVFDPVSGFCVRYDRVSGCEDFYSQSDLQVKDIFTLPPA